MMQTAERAGAPAIDCMAIQFLQGVMDHLARAMARCGLGADPDYSGAAPASTNCQTEPAAAASPGPAVAMPASPHSRRLGVMSARSRAARGQVDAASRVTSSPLQIGDYVCAVPAPGRVVHLNPVLLRICSHPTVLLMENLLSEEECQSIIEAARPCLTPSYVTGGRHTLNRTSTSAFFIGDLGQHPVSALLESKMNAFLAAACLVEGGPPLHLSEAAQVIRYRLGEYYSLHFDNEEAKCREGLPLQRTATIIIYLNDVPQGSGGATQFPLALGLPCAPRSPGRRHEQRDRVHPAHANNMLTIWPKAGAGIIFWSASRDGSLDRTSMHAALPVQRGEKWIATRWCASTESQ